MPAFSLVIEYLTGYAVATDPTDRQRAEWPPHPARVYMALAAAHFETNGPGKDKAEEDAERAALEWLATLPPPKVTIPEHAPREVMTTYVPVNDQSDSLALLRRSKQPRTFPRVHVGTEPFRQTWDVPDDVPSEHLDALDSLCRRVTRIGHSSSLVWMTLDRDSRSKSTHVPDEHGLDLGMRIVQPGAMRRLEQSFNQAETDAYLRLDEVIRTNKGKAKKSLQAEMKERFPQGRPASQRPVFAISRGYREIESEAPACPHTLFDPNFIVLRKADDASQEFGLESTAAITRALRGLLMKESATQPPPPWLSGHEPDGRRLESGHHMALVPLPYVGRLGVQAERHADGHLLGVAIVLPRSVPLRERPRCLAPALFDAATNEAKILELTMGQTGVWRVTREAGVSPRRTLRTDTYTRPSTTWASVTPVLLDRMPKTRRASDPQGWREEVATIISRACARLFDHLDEAVRPEVVAVRVEKTPFFLGSLRAMPGQGGFPLLRQNSYQVHVAVEFDRAVRGPVLLGAGRFRGYGLMRPWLEEHRR